MEAAYKKVMDTKIVIEKALKGEDYSKDLETLTPEQQTSVLLEIKKTAGEAASAELTKLTGLQKAVKAVSEKAEEKESVVLTQFKTDQFEKAKARFFSDPMFTVDEPAKAKILEEYSKIGSGSIDADLVFNDLKRCYALVNSDSLINTKQKAAQMEKDAAAFNASGAGFNGAGPGGSDDKTEYSKAAKDLYQQLTARGFKKTLAECQSMVDKGDNWKVRNLA